MRSWRHIRKLGGLGSAFVVFLPLMLGLMSTRCEAPADSAGATGGSAPAPTAAHFRGVSWVAGDSVTAADFEAVRRCHVGWIAQTPFGWQADSASPVVHLRTTAPRKYWGESDSGLVHTTQLARRYGIQTMLKPHLWLQARGQWPGQIQMRSAADWQAWFESYRTFILHYARLAERHRMEALCIGTELKHAAIGHEQQWRALIRDIRKVYHGQLTYAANWHEEYEGIRFWDALDFIGVQAYFPLSQQPQPDTAQLRRAWQPHLQALAKVQQRYRKPIVFTEAGYRAIPTAAAAPWEWPDPRKPQPDDSQTQAACYEALFRACWRQPWFKGVFIWKWYPGLAPDGSARRHADFTPQHRPAERVLARWYAQ